MLAEPFRSRRAALRSRLPPFNPSTEGTSASTPGSNGSPGHGGGVPARFDHVRSVESTDGREAVEEFWQEAVEGRAEGLMIKVSSS
jgi:DNA ligase-1